MSLVGNKLDREEKREVEYQDAHNFAQKQGVYLSLCRWDSLKLVPRKQPMWNLCFKKPYPVY